MDSDRVAFVQTAAEARTVGEIHLASWQRQLFAFSMNVLPSGWPQQENPSNFKLPSLAKYRSCVLFSTKTIRFPRLRSILLSQGEKNVLERSVGELHQALVRKDFRSLSFETHPNRQPLKKQKQHIPEEKRTFFWSSKVITNSWSSSFLPYSLLTSFNDKKQMLCYSRVLVPHAQVTQTSEASASQVEYFRKKC